MRIVALLLLTGLVSAGCQIGHDERLAALKEEEVAGFTPIGGSLVLDNAFGARTSLGKPYDAEVFRVFVFDDREHAVRGRDSAIESARDSGWRLHRRPDSRFDLVYGAKDLSIGPAMLTIGTSSDHGVDKVSIHVEDRACPDAMCARSS